MLIKNSTSIGDFQIDYDTIRYNNTRGLIHKKEEHFGIKIFKLNNLEELSLFYKRINELNEIETISLQIDINPISIKYFLIIVLKSSINKEDLDIKFNNIDYKLGFEQNLILKNSDLEKSYLNIFGLNEDLTKKSLENLIFKRDKNGFFILDNKSKKYYLLSELSLRNNDILNQLKNNVELFFTVKIYGNLIYIINNKNNKTINNCYFFYHHLFPKDFYERIKNYADVFKNNRNLFHPLKLGKIILRYPVKNSLFVHSKTHNHFIKNRNIINQKKDLIANLVNKDKSVIFNELNNNYLRNILSDIDPNYSIYSSNIYFLFNQCTIVYVLQELNKNNMVQLIKLLKGEYLFCVLFVLNPILFNKITSEINYTHQLLNHFLIIKEKTQLIDCLNIIKKKIKSYQPLNTNTTHIYAGNSIY